MADAATISVTATMLPDEIAKVITGSMTVTPTDANDKWYYKLTTVSTSSTNLMAGSYINRTAIAGASAHAAVATGDKVRFLFVQNTDSSNPVYINISAAASASAVGSMEIPAGETLVLRSPNTTVNTVNALAGTAACICIVAALLDDVA